MRHPLRWVVLGVALAVAALAVVLAANVGRDPSDASASPLLGTRAPRLELTRLDGTPVTSADLVGKTVVVNFWNSWCLPCKAELPVLKAWHEAHRDDPEVVMLGIPRDDLPSQIRDEARAEGIEWTVADDRGAKQATIDFGTTGQPETYVIGPDGVIAGAYRGELSRAALDTMVARAQGTG